MQHIASKPFNEEAQDRPILTPESQLLNLWLVQFHGFVALVSRVNIAEDHSAITMQQTKTYLLVCHNQTSNLGAELLTTTLY